MKDYPQKARALLEKTCLPSHYVESIRQEYFHALDALRRCTPVVLCGHSPYARQICDVIKKKYGSEIIIVDNDPENNNSGGILLPDYLDSSPEDYVYVSASSVFLGHYIKKLAARGIKNIIPYHALPIIDEELDGKRKAYTHDFFLRGIEHITKNRDAYRNLLLSLADDESVQIFAKLICYRLTAETGAAFGVQSGQKTYISATSFCAVTKKRSLSMAGALTAIH